MDDLTSAAPEAGATTAHGDMIPVSETSDNFIKRVVRVRKQRQELFGWRLSPIDKGLYVIAIDEITSEYTATAAYRAGIKFGDRITHVAGQVVSYKSDLYAMMQELKDSIEVQVDLIEAPLFTPHSFEVTFSEWENLGIAYSNGMVTEVRDGSPAKKLGVEPECTIVQVSNWSTLGMTDENVKATVLKAAQAQIATGHKHVVIKTMPRDQATQLHDGIDLMLKEMPTKTRPRSVADAVNTYLALDPLQQSTEDLEKIVYRAKADVGKSLSRRLSRGGGAETASHDVILTPSRHAVNESDGVHEEWTYMGEITGKAKGTLPRFIVDGSLLGHLQTKEIAYVREQATEVRDNRASVLEAPNA